MKKAALFLILLVAFYTNAQEKKPLTIGESVTLYSKVLSENRILNIALPDDYNEKTNHKYQVIYLLDGTLNEDFLHVVGLIQFFNLQLNMPKTIVVGISNIDRRRDFTFPTIIEDLKKDYPTTGHSEAFITFLETELMPFIQTNYRVSEKKYIIGQSLGGLLATEILLKKPQLFSDYIIISPSLWWDDESLLHQAEELINENNSSIKNVSLAVGNEHKTMVKDAKEFNYILEKHKNRFKVNFRYLAKENHATILHNSLYEMFLLEYPYKEPK